MANSSGNTSDRPDISEGPARVQPIHWLMTVVAYLFFAIFLLWPIAQVVYTGFRSKSGGLTFEYVQLIFADPVLRQGLINSFTVAGCTTLLALIIALPMALLSVKCQFPGRALFSGLVLVPLVLPPFVGAIGLRLILGREGPLTEVLRTLGFDLPNGLDWIGSLQMVGIVVIQALGLYPIMLLNLQAALANIDPAMEQAAGNLGASRLTIFRRITLPLMRPGLFAGCTIVLIWSFTELGTPLMFDFYEITSVQVFKQITDVSDNPLPYALVVVMLVASSLLYLVGKVILGRGFDAATTKAGTVATPTKLTGWKGYAAAGFFAAVFLTACLPHLAVILTSLSSTGSWYQSILPTSLTLQHFAGALRDSMVMNSMGNSIMLASMATVVACAMGLLVAVLIVRSNVPGKGLIDALAMLPLAVPGLVLAFGYLSISIYFKRVLGPDLTGPGKSLVFLNVAEFPVVFLVLAYAARRLPYVVRSAVAGLQQTPKDLELAAANLGASRSTVLARITVPLILANLIAGGLLAFAFAMLEVSDSLILAQQAQYYPITKAIWELSQRLGDGIYLASALGVWAMLVLTLTILTASSILGKKMGAIFRV